MAKKKKTMARHSVINEKDRIRGIGHFRTCCYGKIIRSGLRQTSSPSAIAAIFVSEEEKEEEEVTMIGADSCVRPEPVVNRLLIFAFRLLKRD